MVLMATKKRDTSRDPVRARPSDRLSAEIEAEWKAAVERSMEVWREQQNKAQAQPTQSG